MKPMWKSVDDVLDYAMAEEQKAVAIYHSIAEQSTAETKKLFEGFAKDEARHLRKLLAMKDKMSAAIPDAQVAALRIPRVKVALREQMTAEAAYQFVIQAESGAVELYSMMAQTTQDPKIRAVFLELTADEAGHRAKLESDLAKHESSVGFLQRLIRFVTKG